MQKAGDDAMYESVCTVGERGQITIPKHIRKIRGIKAKDKVVMKIDGDKILVEKAVSKKEKEELMKEFHLKYAKLNKQIDEEWKFASVEADRLLDEY